jgi:hypothetical protein
LQRLEDYRSKKYSPTIQDKLIEQMYGNMPMRRKQALLKAAHIYATERESSTVEFCDLIRAEKWTYSSFLELEKGMS